jgi:hypothetical protein
VLFVNSANTVVKLQSLPNLMLSTVQSYLFVEKLVGDQQFHAFTLVLYLEKAQILA